MKKYIKPSINSLEIESAPVMAAGSLTDDGSQGDLGGNGGLSGASGGRSKRHSFDTLWDETWDDDDDESNE